MSDPNGSKDRGSNKKRGRNEPSEQNQVPPPLFNAPADPIIPWQVIQAMQLQNSNQNLDPAVMANGGFFHPVVTAEMVLQAMASLHTTTVTTPANAHHLFPATLPPHLIPPTTNNAPLFSSNVPIYTVPQPQTIPSQPTSSNSQIAYAQMLPPQPTLNNPTTATDLPASANLLPISATAQPQMIPPTSQMTPPTPNTAAPNPTFHETELVMVVTKMLELNKANEKRNEAVTSFAGEEEELRAMRERAEAADRDKAKSENALQQANTTIDELRDTLTEKSDELKQVTNAGHSEYQRAETAVRDRTIAEKSLAKKSEEFEELRHTLQNRVLELETAKKAEEREHQRAEAAEITKRAAELEVGRLSGELEDLGRMHTTVLANLAQANQSLTAERQRAEAQVIARRTAEFNANRLTVVLAASRRDLATANGEVERLAGDLVTANAAVAQLTRDLGDLQVTHNSSVSELDTVRGEVARLTDELAGLRIELGDVRANLRRASDEANDAEEQHREALRLLNANHAAAIQRAHDETSQQRQLVIAAERERDEAITARDNATTNARFSEEARQNAVRLQTVAEGRTQELSQQNLGMVQEIEGVEERLREANRLRDQQRIAADLQINRVNQQVRDLQAGTEDLSRRNRDLATEIEAARNTANLEIDRLQTEMNDSRGRLAEAEAELAELRGLREANLNLYRYLARGGDPSQYPGQAQGAAAADPVDPEAVPAPAPDVVDQEIENLDLPVAHNVAIDPEAVNEAPEPEPEPEIPEVPVARRRRGRGRPSGRGRAVVRAAAPRASESPERHLTREEAVEHSNSVRVQEIVGFLKQNHCLYDIANEAHPQTVSNPPRVDNLENWLSEELGSAAPGAEELRRIAEERIKLVKLEHKKQKKYHMIEALSRSELKAKKKKRIGSSGETSRGLKKRKMEMAQKVKKSDSDASEEFEDSYEEPDQVDRDLGRRDEDKDEDDGAGAGMGLLANQPGSSGIAAC